MEKDDGETQVNKLVNWVAERSPQQLHASNDHQKNVPAVGKERKEAISDGVQATRWVALANVPWALRVHYALHRHKKPIWGSLLLCAFYRGVFRGSESLSNLSRVSQGQSKDGNSTLSDSQARCLCHYRHFLFITCSSWSLVLFCKDAELLLSLPEVTAAVMSEVPQKAWCQVSKQATCCPCGGLLSVCLFIRKASDWNSDITTANIKFPIEKKIPVS